MLTQPLRSQIARYTVAEEACSPIPLSAVRDLAYRGPVVGVVMAGIFDYRAAGGATTAVPGTLLLGNANEAFRCEHRQGSGNRRQVVRFDAAILEDIASSVGLSAAKFRAAAVPPGELAARAFGCMRRLARDNSSDEAAYELAGLALQVNRSALLPARVPIRNQRRILEVVHQLEETYNERWSLSDLAKLAHMSTYHFLRTFKAVTGQSPNQFIMYLRLRAAANGLLNPDSAVAEIALRVGFNDISHFNACFRRAFGRAPSRWRA
ncbi:MAG TPA: AraC family transcriptional regulator [Steroidobacteraceae bacterium]